MATSAKIPTGRTIVAPDARRALSAQRCLRTARKEPHRSAMNSGWVNPSTPLCSGSLLRRAEYPADRFSKIL